MTSTITANATVQTRSVSLGHITYRAGGTCILGDVSVSFRPCGFNVILGPNGAGKSTLLRIATGLLEPDEGTVTYDGVPVKEIGREALARRRAVLSQHVDPAFPLPARDVVMMGRYPHFGQTPTARDREIVERALEITGMADKASQPYPTLSGGERQKIHLARVLAQIWNRDRDGDYSDASGHRVLFLDEPTNSLDVHYQLHLLDAARNLTSHDVTVIAVLHDINLALQYGDAFFVLSGGRLVHEADSAADVRAELLERVFRVRAHLVPGPADAPAVWRFTI